MSDIVITKLTGDCSDPIANCTTVTIRNFNSLDFELCTIVGDFPIPESDDTNNILVKGEGNRLNISVGWTIACETVNIWNGSYPLTGTNGSCPNTYSKVTLCATKTVQEQIAFFIEYFQVQSIEDKYSILVDGITRHGSIKKMTFNKSGQTPVTYDARLEFIAGDVVAGEA